MPFFENRKNKTLAKANVLILKKNALFMCIYELSYHLSNSYLSWRKNTKIFPCGTLLFFVIHKTFTKGPLTQNYFAIPKNFWLRVCKMKLFEKQPTVLNTLCLFYCLENKK